MKSSVRAGRKNPVHREDAKITKKPLNEGVKRMALGER
jgi:hypothetical protein